MAADRTDRTTGRGRTGGPGWLIGAIAAIVVLGLLALLLVPLLTGDTEQDEADAPAAQEQQQEQQQQEQPAAVAPEQPAAAPAQEQETAPAAQHTISISDINDNPQAYVGQNVTVTGGIDEFHGEQAFTITDNGGVLGLGGGNELLVIGEQPFAPMGDEVDEVRVHGTVQMMTRAEIEQQVGAALGDDFWANGEEAESRPVLMADEVTPMPGIGDLADDHQAWIGQTISVRGDIDELHGERAFTLSEGGGVLGIGGGNEVLVVATDEMAMGATAAGAYEEGTEVRVTGEVRTFNRAEIEQEFGMTLEEGLFQDYEGQAVILADTITILEDQQATGAQQPEAGQPQPAPGAVPGQETDPAQQHTVSISDINDNPETYVGRTVTVTGDIDERYSEQAFTITDNGGVLGLGGGNELLVIGEQPFAPMGDEVDEVRVHGTVQMMTRAEIEQQVGAALGDDFWANGEEAESRPVLMADEVTPIVDLGDLNDNLAAWTGQTVTVRGDVDEIYGNRVFTLSEGGDILGIGEADEVLIVARDEMAMANGAQGAQAGQAATGANGNGAMMLEEGAEVRVTGEVQVFDRDQIQQQTGATLDEATFPF